MCVLKFKIVTLTAAAVPKPGSLLTWTFEILPHLHQIPTGGPTQWPTPSEFQRKDTKSWWIPLTDQHLGGIEVLKETGNPYAPEGGNPWVTKRSLSLYRYPCKFVKWMAGFGLAFGCNCNQKRWNWGLIQDHVTGVRVGVEISPSAQGTQWQWVRETVDQQSLLSTKRIWALFQTF